LLLWDAAKTIFYEDFAAQGLSFDSDAADVYAEIVASRRMAGKPISQFDGMIVEFVFYFLISANLWIKRESDIRKKFGPRPRASTQR
jgi:hypothetical protein